MVSQRCPPPPVQPQPPPPQLMTPFMLNEYIANPIVQNALGAIPTPNQNCCAICGSAFRLTADLVQHMRANHRSSKFKRTQKRPQ
uniref:C2H2-type domain-containing protein n=1 Tax=Parascaris equorum TaxID=6256 RepID=A0A914RZP7_PAREQ